MNRWKKTALLFSVLVSLFLNGINAQEKDDKNVSRPNVVLILADDFGYSSLNCYGAGKNLVRTPQIDKIAENGMMFSNASTPASVCTPTRYGILTGQYPWRSSLKFGLVNPIDELLPDPKRVTIADWLKERGYQTAAIGKWHLGYGKEPLDYTKSLSPGPLDLGFDYHFGVPQNHGDELGVYIENDHIYGQRTNKVNGYSRTYYGTQYTGYDAPQRVNKNVMDDLTNKSVDWLKKQTGKQPFFLYFGAVAVHEPITPSDYMRGMSDCGPYGDFIQDLDLSVGRILETLEYMNLMENTIVIFTSDNGGVIPDNNSKAPEIVAINHGLKINGDLRGGKHTIYEGGTKVPFIISWPENIRKGSVSNDMINLIDIFATICDITDGEVPKSKNIAPDSFSFSQSLISSKNQHPRTSMVTADTKGMHAIRMGDWKYIDIKPPVNFPESRMNEFRSIKPQLYNLKDDPAEQVNLYDHNPEKVKELSKELERIRKADSTR